MARPTKSGIDYFPLDVELEDKVKILEAKHGLVGFAVWVKLMQKIYKHGYYIKWEEENKILFASEVNEPIEKINEIILDCVNYEIFNKEKLEKYNILTSRGIQKRYLEATKRRKEVEVCKHYLLTNGVNEYKNLVYVNNNSENVDNNSQSKVEEKRVEEHIDEVEEIIDTWTSLLSDVHKPTGTKRQKEAIITKLKKWNKEKIIKAIKNYNEIYRSGYYYSHNWTMYKFIKQGNGAPRFLPGLDQEEDGDIWKDYQSSNYVMPESVSKEEVAKHIEDIC